MNAKSVGEKTVGIILARLLRLDKTVCFPFGDNQRYDLLIDEDGTFVRAQCKTGRLLKGCLVFAACSNNWHKKTRQSYRGQCDVFLVYSPDLDKIFRVPVGDVGEAEGSLRIDQLKIQRVANARWAKDYEM